MENKDLYLKIMEILDEKWLIDNIERLWKTELGQTFADYRNAAKLTAGIMKEAGIIGIEKISFPADGKTIYQDKISPLAWNATCGSMTIIKSPVHIEDKVVADYKRHPFHLIKGSVSTPAEGLNVRLITQEQLFHGQDAKNTMVILDADTRPTYEIVRYMLDSGVTGWVNTSLSGRYTTPDGICWVNACTEGPQWHVHLGDRPFIAFSVSPKAGDALLSAARKGELTANIKCDGKRHKGKVDIVTGTIPGKTKKELWLIGHLYEPLPDDNSLGVIAGISIAKTLNSLFDSKILPMPRFTLRLIFGLEMYGFAAYADKRGKNLKNEVIGAINLDGLACRKREPVNYWLSPQGSPFFGNYLVEDMAEKIPSEILPDVRFTVKREGAYFDDMFLADSTTSIPVIWPLRQSALHHNSCQTMEILEPAVIKQQISFQTVLTARLLTTNSRNVETLIKQASVLAVRHLNDEAADIMKNLLKNKKPAVRDIEEAKLKIKCSYETEKKQIEDFSGIASPAVVAKALRLLSETKKNLIGKLETSGRKENKNVFSQPFSGRKGICWKISETIVPSRNSKGFPYDLAKVPKADRKYLPDGCLYGPFSRILANMDGKRNLEYLIRQAEWESKQAITDSMAREYLGAIEFLSEYGYIKNRYTLIIRKKDIIVALEKAGIESGDLLLVHSGLAYFGHIEGGANTVIDAFLEVLGAKGTLLFPTFTRPFIYFNGDCLAGLRYRVYDSKETSVYVGKIPSVFLNRKDVVRSSHPTHSVAGIGPLVQKCLLEHKLSDPPACRRSPFGKLLDYGGKMVWFGAGLASTTFFHFLEDELDMPYLAEAVCRVKKADGSVRTLLIDKHLPGHRDFYRNSGEDTKIYRKLIEKGLVIKKSNLGFGEIKVIDAKQMYDLGMESLREDPALLLCDDRKCIFCSTNRR
ncbi:MAG: AAC(3) family N-acetyltransferase [Candidatus Omnitrophica bacterium]|nr:AAC(3) family N-acetyltransferase [Candidatus Omnitrophota bacterium]